MLVVGLAVGLGILFIIIAIIVAACCVLRKVRFLSILNEKFQAEFDVSSNNFGQKI